MRTLNRILAAALGALGLLANAPAAPPEAARNLALGATATASSVLKPQYGPQKAFDGEVNNDSRWVGKDAETPQILTVDLDARQAVGCIQLAMGWENGGEWNSWTRSFVIQYWDGDAWQAVPGADVKDNNAVTRRFLLATPVHTDKVRIVARDKKAMRLAELWIFAPNPQGYPPLPELKQSNSIEGGAHQSPPFQPVKTILVNQSGYNLDWPKRFTAPLAEGEKEFVIAPAGSPDQVLYRGVVKSGLGDFTDFRPAESGREYIIKVQDGRSSDTTSDPFVIEPYWLQRLSFEPALRFMVDSRSVVGTHPSAFGGGPWRDSAFYTYELPSLVMLYLSSPDVYEQAPLEMNWQADKARVLAPDFKFVHAKADGGALEAARRYYQELDPPVGERVPDIIQLIHWGAGYYMLHPVAIGHGDEGEPQPRQTIEQLAHFLYGYPWYKQYISEGFFRQVSDFTFGQWEKAGLFNVLTGIGDFKGRECPGHSVLPNLMMHEVARRLGRADARRYLDAAVAQARWIVEKLDFKDPLVTKGQRMSEHMLITGLVAMLRDYPEAAPAGLREKLAEWAGIMISRSGNMWDFRRYDEQYWALPATTPNTRWTSTWNEPGNICGFPALCFAVASQLDDAAMRRRLEQLAASHWDNWFGRNPIGAHAGYKGPQQFPGVERGWPVKFPDDVCARLELCRGVINATAATDHYPFNPAGQFRHVEGWTAFNSAFNVALSYSVIHDTKIELLNADFTAPLQGIQAGSKVGVRLSGPLIHPKAEEKSISAIVTAASGDEEKLKADESAPGAFACQAALPVAYGDPTPGDGVLQVKAGDKVSVAHGYGYFKRSAQFQVNNQ